MAWLQIKAALGGAGDAEHLVTAVRMEEDGPEQCWFPWPWPCRDVAAGAQVLEAARSRRESLQASVFIQLSDRNISKSGSRPSMRIREWPLGKRSEQTLGTITASHCSAITSRAQAAQ